MNVPSPITKKFMSHLYAQLSSAILSKSLTMPPFFGAVLLGTEKENIYCNCNHLYIGERAHNHYPTHKGEAKPAPTLVPSPS